MRSDDQATDQADAPVDAWAMQAADQRLAGVADEELSCAQEQIHLPAAIQPHGVLVAVDPASSLVACVSANAAALFGRACETLIDRPVLEILPPFALAEAQAVAERPDAPRRSRLQLSDGTKLDCRAHAADGLALLELERRPAADGGDPDLGFNAVARLSARIAAADTPQALLDAVCAETRGLLGVDRALILRFEPDWTSAVIAEDIATDWPQPLRGLHFPAGDIPAQARALYAAHRTRALPDRLYVPSPLVPEILPRLGRSIDLSGARLRSQSAAHRAYLANLGVDSALSVSILRRGRLWGLLMAHHRTRHGPPDAVIEALPQAMDLFSLRLEALEQAAQDQARRDLAVRFERLTAALAAADDVFAALRDAPEDLAALIDAPSLYLWVDEQAATPLGPCPPPSLMARLLDYARAHRRDGVFVHDRLSQIDAAFADWGHVAGGAVAVFFGPDRADALVWLRPEEVREIAWAGEPIKVIGDDGALLPRRNFSRWIEERRGWARPVPEWRLTWARSLAHAVDAWAAAQHRRLRRAHAALQAANQAKSDFLASMSHELRTPLNAVIGFSDLLRMGVGGELPEQSLAWVEQIDRAGRHLLSLVNDVLDFAKLEAGRYAVHPDWVAPAPMVMEALQTVEAAALAAGVHLVDAAPATEDGPELYADDRALRQMLLNLLSNAIKFTPSGGRILVELGRDEAGLTLSVSDEGPGMADELVDRIGEPFLQDLSVAQRKLEGSGLGLSIVKSLVEAHDGALLVGRAEIGGARFSLRFPPERVRG